MATLNVKLKQHTPLIHFQHYQAGATLRASELKPKLDKFLIKYFIENQIDYKKWLIGDGKHNALNYKVKIIPTSNIDFYLPFPTEINIQRSKNLSKYIKEKASMEIKGVLSPTPYFGNADKVKFSENEINCEDTKISELRYATYSDQEIALIFTIWDTELRDIIKALIVDFFLLHNFGSRQNKGFGSYSVKSIENDNISVNEDKFKKFFLAKSQYAYTNFNKLFSFILSEYQLLKSGQNYPSYSKSKLFEYFVQRGIRWEKRFIKQKINSYSSRLGNKKLYTKKSLDPIDFNAGSKVYYNSWKDKQQNEYKFIRALLGLADHYEFLIDFNGSPDKKNKFVVDIEHLPKDKRPKFERIPSPLFFKVLDGRVYLGIDFNYKVIQENKIVDMYKEIFDEQFEFTVVYNNNKISIGSLLVPDKFDIVDFIKSLITNQTNNWTIY